MRQYFDNLEEDCKKDDSQLPNLVEALANLEANRLIVTTGEWKEAMRNIMDAHPDSTQKVEGLDSSVYELVKVVRNEMGHKDPKDFQYALFEAVRHAYHWLVMHCFQHRVRFILPADPNLLVFANEFDQNTILCR